VISSIKGLLQSQTSHITNLRDLLANAGNIADIDTPSVQGVRVGTRRSGTSCPRRGYSGQALSVLQRLGLMTAVEVQSMFMFCLCLSIANFANTTS